LFNDAPAAPAGDEAPMDDLFNDAPAPAPAADSLDDLFNAPADAAPAAPAAPAEKLDDIFGSAPAAQQNVVSIELKPQVDPLEESRERVWIDNTGSFSTQGRLIEIGEDFIRLMKENGRTCTVPMDRLCPADAVYVDAIRTELQQHKLAMLTAR
jgi:3-oxoacyl-ACP reductase-like protein